MDVNSYLSGFVDGEGCFCVSINRSKRHKFGWEVRPSFSVSQNSNRVNILELLKEKFKCGAIRPDRSDKTLKFEVRSIDDLVGKVIPHFKRYPLLSNKQSEFERFAVICRMMQERKHLTIDGIRKILEVTRTINLSGKKKFLREEIKL